MQTERDKLVAFNERVKLFAGFLNAIGLGLIGFAVLRPLSETPSNPTWAVVWWGVIGLAMYAVSHYILERLRKEMKNDPV
jgi:Co/Zn/Cd efflux system component